jgi:hypothetical protein
VSAGLARFAHDAWPLLLVAMPASMNMTAIESIIAGFEGAHGRKERFVLVVDCSAVSRFPGAEERRRLIDWMKEEAQNERARRDTIGAAVVLTSGTMRALMSAINWVHPPAAPQVWKATLGEAIEWGCTRLVEAGLELTPAINALRVETRRREVEPLRKR